MFVCKGVGGLISKSKVRSVYKDGGGRGVGGLAKTSLYSSLPGKGNGFLAAG